MVFGSDGSEFAKQGVAGTVYDPKLRTQESSQSIFIGSGCLWSSLGICRPKYRGVYKCELSL